MALILAIDTALESASVCLCRDEEVLALEINNSPKDHAAWLQPSIEKMLKDGRQTVNDIDAVAVSIGPGSYTGLRVGLASTKGLCYAANKPLIAVNTLEMMAFAAKETNDFPLLFCPMIDARRMEVFTAVFNHQLDVVISPQAVVLDHESFSELLKKEKILFFGNGARKFSELCSHSHAMFSSVAADASHLARLSHAAYKKKNFSSLAYTEPFYLKEFHGTIPKPLI